MMKRNKLTAVILAAMMLAGCGNGGADSSYDSVQSAVTVTAREALADISSEKLDGMTCMGDESFDNNAEKFYGVGLESIEDGGILYNAEGGYADEVSFVKFKAGVDGGALLQKRLADRTAAFRDYRPEELPKLEKAKLISAGGYDLLIISDDAEAIAAGIEDKLS